MPQKNIKRSIAMSEEMHALLAQTAARHGRDITESHLIREAIRQFLDEQVDAVGSRRHFQKSLQLRLDRLERTLVFQMNIVIYLLSAILDRLLHHATTLNVKGESYRLKEKRRAGLLGRPKPADAAEETHEQAEEVMPMTD